MQLTLPGCPQAGTCCQARSSCFIPSPCMAAAQHQSMSPEPAQPASCSRVRSCPHQPLMSCSSPHTPALQSLRLSYTPRKFLVHPERKTLVIAEADHAAVPAAEREPLPPAFAEVGSRATWRGLLEFTCGACCGVQPHGHVRSPWQSWVFCDAPAAVLDSSPVWPACWCGSYRCSKGDTAAASQHILSGSGSPPLLVPVISGSSPQATEELEQLQMCKPLLAEAATQGITGTCAGRCGRGRGSPGRPGAAAGL